MALMYQGHVVADVGGGEAGGGGLYVGELPYAEYQALTEEQKKAGAYFVPDYPGPDKEHGGAGKVYSLEEKVVGVWIDGRPVYQKTFRFEGLSLGGSSANNDLPVDLDSLNVDLLIDASGFYCDSTNSEMMLNSRFGAIFTMERKLKMRQEKQSSTMSGVTAVVTLEYIKTTDTPKEVTQ